MSDASPTIAASYAACRLVARRAGSSFYPCFRLLSPPQRQAMEALYAFLRHSDDLGDGAEPLDQRRHGLARWRAALQSALAGEGATGCSSAGAAPSSSDPHVVLLPALADSVGRFGIPHEHLLAVLDGVAMDLEGRCYETFDELAGYCHRVASAVGLACLYVWGFRGDGAFGPARQCGVAFQVTNILRDLKEDAARGRLYLPAADLRQCDYTPDDLLRGAADARFARLMRLEIDRARQCYRLGAELFDWLEPAGRRVFGMMTGTYWELLRKIESSPARVLAGRVRLARWRKLAIALRWTLLPPRRSALP